MAKVGGGENPMHLSNTAHPFQGNGRTPKPKMASSQGCHPTAAGSVGFNQTASANMTKKRTMNGSGKA